MMKTFEAYGRHPLSPEHREPDENGSKTKAADAKVLLSDEELEQISAAGETNCIPTMNVEVMLGRREMPEDADRRR